MRHLLGVEELGSARLLELLKLTDTFAEVNRRPIPKVPALRGKTVAMVFYEDSTRTRLSFETAAKRLSADTMTFTVGSSSVNKGESLRDTVETVQAMGVDAMVVRHRSAGAPHQVARWVDAAVINAGDGWHEHPTQALLDAFTVREHFGQVEGLRIAIVGDIKHSRVARSDTWAFSSLGADVVWVAPPTLLPPAVLDKVDVIYLLRMQLERQEGGLVPSLREYTTRYGLTARRVDQMADEAVVLHPGPMNRGVEIGGDVAELPRALVTDQVRNGVSVRMAVLYWLLGSGAELVPEEETRG
jgi:aspartate carbamoyltransferase catalytic subunit